MKYGLAIGVLIVCGAAGCSQSDAVSTECASMHPRSSAPVAAADELSQTLSDCNADKVAHVGSNCDSTAFVSSGAAICVAQAAGLESGLSTLSAGLSYDPRYHRVAWGVSNLLYDDAHPPPSDGGSGTSGGRFFAIDAETLSVLWQGAWDRVP
jgi:hypothetical protein